MREEVLGGILHPPLAKRNDDLYREGMVDVVAVSVAGGAACLGFKYIPAFPLVSSSSL